MGYVEENLLPGETILLQAKPHWAMFILPGTITALCGLFVLPGIVTSGLTLGDPQIGEGALTGLICGFSMFLFVAVLMVGSATARYLTTEFAITDRRIIAKRGLLRRKSLEVMLPKVESIGVTQSILGRFFGFGTIVVSGTGGTRQKFPNIAEPMKLRNQINARIATSLE